MQGENNPFWWLPRLHDPPLRFAAVMVALVKPPADPSLQVAARRFLSENGMGGQRPPAANFFGEQPESALGR
jgi:hypothetical protein